MYLLISRSFNKQILKDESSSDYLRNKWYQASVISTHSSHINKVISKMLSFLFSNDLYLLSDAINYCNKQT